MASLVLINIRTVLQSFVYGSELFLGSISMEPKVCLIVIRDIIILSYRWLL